MKSSDPRLSGRVDLKVLTTPWTFSSVIYFIGVFMAPRWSGTFLLWDGCWVVEHGRWIGDSIQSLGIRGHQLSPKYMSLGVFSFALSPRSFDRPFLLPWFYNSIESFLLQYVYRVSIPVQQSALCYKLASLSHSPYNRRPNTITSMEQVYDSSAAESLSLIK